VNDPLAGVTGFDWDRGNLAKSRVKHGVSPEEAEEVFLGAPVVAEGARHSKQEPRWIAYGKTFEGRALAIAFTVRGKLVRVISARPMNEKERNDYA
jgi:uncharacterized protein